MLLFLSAVLLKHTLKHKKESKECWCQEEKVNDKF